MIISSPHACAHLPLSCSTLRYAYPFLKNKTHRLNCPAQLSTTHTLSLKTQHTDPSPPAPAPAPGPDPSPSQKPVMCDLIHSCPAQTTCCCNNEIMQGICWEWACCPMEEAVCCEDKEHVRTRDAREFFHHDADTCVVLPMKIFFLRISNSQNLVDILCFQDTFLHLFIR